MIPGVNDDALLGTLFILNMFRITLASVFEKLLFATKLIGQDGGHMRRVAGIGKGVDGFRGWWGRLGWAGHR